MITTPTIEYNIVEHCNLRCQNCDHASPFFTSTVIDRDTIARDLRALAAVMHCGEIKVVGGEPLLHPDLPAVLAACRASGIAERLTLATNGTLLHVMREECWALIDRLWLSIYPGIKMRLRAEEIEELAARHNVRIDRIEMPAFRHTLLKNRNHNRQLTEQIYRKCALRSLNWCHTVRSGRYYKCSPAAFLFTSVRHIEGIGVPLDSVPLHDNQNLEEDLRHYIDNPRPLDACSFCLGSSGIRFAHRQMTKREITAHATVPESINDLIDWKMLEEASTPSEPPFFDFGRSAIAQYRLVQRSSAPRAP
jgi:organic radical activating enzyme